MVEKNEDEKKKKGRSRKAAAKETHKEELKQPAKAPEAVKAEEPKKAETPKRRKRSSAKKEPRKVFVARGKRKESVARATISEGNGAVRLNSLSLASINNPYIADIIREPLRYVGPEAGKIDISVNVSGGGRMGQAQAARTAIANALAMYFDEMNLKQKFIEIDRSLVIEDTRRVEPKKFRGPKARARFQKSYR